MPVVDIAVIRARSLADYARVILAVVRRQQHKNRHIRFFTAQQGPPGSGAVAALAR